MNDPIFMEKSFEVIIIVRMGNTHAPCYTKNVGTRQAANKDLHFRLKHLYAAIVLKLLVGNFLLYVEKEIIRALVLEGDLRM